MTVDLDLSHNGRRSTAEVTTLQPGDAKCSWCGQDLQVRRGGSPQRFWSTSDVLIEARLEEAGAPPQVHLEAGLDLNGGDAPQRATPFEPLNPPVSANCGIRTSSAARN